MKTRIHVRLLMNLADVAKVETLLSVSDDTELLGIEVVKPTEFEDMQIFAGTAPENKTPVKLPGLPSRPLWHTKPRTKERGPDDGTRKRPVRVTREIVKEVFRIENTLWEDTQEHVTHAAVAELLPADMNVSDKTVGKIRAGEYNHLLEN